MKTALFASDPNWGRILAAVGRAPYNTLNIENVSISLNDLPIVTAVSRIQPIPKKLGQRAVASSDISVEIRLGESSEAVTVWTSDLSHEYVRINAEYRT